MKLHGVSVSQQLSMPASWISRGRGIFEMSEKKPDDGTLIPHSAQELSIRTALVKRGLQALTPVIHPATIDWENATIRGVCYKAKKHYGPREFPTTRRFFFVCRIENNSQSRQAPSGLRIFRRSEKGASFLRPQTRVSLCFIETKPGIGQLTSAQETGRSQNQNLQGLFQSAVPLASARRNYLETQIRLWRTIRMEGSQ